MTIVRYSTTREMLSHTHSD